MNIERTLREAARNSGLSIKAMADQTGIPYAGLYRFIREDARTITLPTADRLAALLAFELRPVRRRKGTVSHGKGKS